MSADAFFKHAETSIKDAAWLAKTLGVDDKVVAVLSAEARARGFK